MSHSKLPQSDADRIAAGFTAFAIAAIVWVILAVFPNPRDLQVMTAQASMARVVDSLSPQDKPVPILSSPRFAVEHLAKLTQQ